ncbi:MAG: cytochrome d ubiquinol oxidase subunit II [Bacteroidaceae bacterium]|nr:cytochrome d ubiquinol oxidase subunit II [Bacteroidaceae bacterium]
MSYSFLQHYWWFLVSLLGALLVFLMFVQGGNAVAYTLGRTEEERRLIFNSTGRKWEYTFTTLVTFGGAFFASFPLFYSTSFGGAYWVWMLLLVSFVVQAVSYEFQSKVGNVLGQRGYRLLLQFNGFIGPFVLGAAVATFFNGAEFTVNQENLGDTYQPVVSTWASSWHGLEALGNFWNWCLGLAVCFLARTLGILYIMNNVDDDTLRSRGSVQLVGNAGMFLLFFLAFLIRTLFKDGFAVAADGTVVMEPMKYLHNLLAMWPVLLLLLAGVALVLFGIVKTIRSKTYVRGIWPVGVGTVLTVLALLLCAGWNHTAYYPSTADLQSSLTLANSSSSLFTLQVMAVVSLIIPFVLAYIVWCWRAIDLRSITRKELEEDEHTY